MTTQYKPDDAPRFAPDLLNVHVIEGASYAQAKRLLESYGVTVLPQDRTWEQLSILQIQIPYGKSLDEWRKLLLSEIAISRITTVPMHSLGYNLKTVRAT